MPTAEILAIGNELLLGRTLDTNTHWLARQLSRIGLPLAHTQTLPDESAAIQAGVQLALSRAQVVICTGGLGPTSDDLTAPVLAQLFGMEMAVHEPTLRHIEALYRSRGREPNASVPRQATLPVGADILQNNVGTAAGLRFTTPDGREVYALPGVPHEMKHLFETHIAAHLSARFVSDFLRQHTLRTAAVPESELAARIADIEEALPPEIFLAYNPSLHMVDLRLNLRAPAEQKDPLSAQFGMVLQQLRHRLGADLYGEENDSLAGSIGRVLMARGETVAVAESCTGGLLFHTLVEEPGASAYVRGGVVPYSNDLKMTLVGVSEDSLTTHGAVSEAVACELAQGVRTRLQATWGLGVTGIAGPEGGSDAKPVGTVWIAVSGPTGTHARHFLFERHRLRNMQRSVVMALEMLRRQLIRQNENNA